MSPQQVQNLSDTTQPDCEQDVELILTEDPLAVEYAERQGNSCARHTWAMSHFWTAFVLADVALYFWLHSPQTLFAAILLLLTGLLLTSVAFRLFIVFLSLWKNPQVTVTGEEVDATAASELPTYTVLVPLYKEANVAKGIVASLGRLTYPRDRLDIKLLLEADDDITIAAVERLSLSDEFDVVFVPPGLPRTKPRACNHGLLRARGELAVIFDAEDRPEADQLLKVVHAFRSVDDSVACIQAKLNYYNPRENFLTKCFALEYTAWFDLVLPGIQYLNGPIPLGGTSNHFRTDVLRKFDGWDPYNVTEDCDLGVRLATGGYRTLLIDSTTWEEANTQVGNWIRQRSRWVKGYMQTCLVHTKRAFNLVRTMGIRRALLFHLCITSVPLQQLVNLVCWPVTLLFGALLLMDWWGGRDPWLVLAGSRDEYRIAWKMLYLEVGETPAWAAFSVVGFIGSVCMLLANCLFVLVNLLASRRRNLKDLWLPALLSPFYWTLGSLAAWKGAIQLIFRPHYWEKTVHGLTTVEAGAASVSEGEQA